jgi:hypothetical protein
MTNEQAKEKLYMQWQEFLENNLDYAGISEAYQMAFKALTEPQGDLISREEVLLCLTGENLDKYSYTELIALFSKRIKGLSSKQTEDEKLKVVRQEILDSKQYRGSNGNPVLDAHDRGLDRHFDLGLDKAVKIIDEHLS